jgi:hypothetical protein
MSASPGDAYGGSIDPRMLAIEVAVCEIASELGRHLCPLERIAITRALEGLADNLARLPRRRP